MTDLLYHADSYLKEFQATVTDVTESSVVLDRTAFYPGGKPNTPNLGLPDYRRNSWGILLDI